MVLRDFFSPTCFYLLLIIISPTLANLIWVVYNCICYGVYSVDTCITKEVYVYILHGFSDTNWSWYLYFDVQTIDPFHPYILYFMKNLVVPRYSQIRFRNSILPINNTGDINPNGSYIETKVLSVFLLVKRWLSVGISTLNVSLFIAVHTQYFSSIRFCFEMFFCKVNSFWELRLSAFFGV